MTSSPRIERLTREALGAPHDPIVPSKKALKAIAWTLITLSVVGAATGTMTHARETMLQSFIGVSPSSSAESGNVSDLTYEKH